MSGTSAVPGEHLRRLLRDTVPLKKGGFTAAPEAHGVGEHTLLWN